jgi:hypothetical protein
MLFSRHRQFLFSARSSFAFEFHERRFLVHKQMVGHVAFIKYCGSSFEASMPNFMWFPL